MSEDIIKRIKISVKGEGKIIVLLKNISKKESLKSIRDKNTKISSEYQFYDGEDLIDFDIEKDYEIGDIIDNEGKIYVKSKNDINTNNNINVLETNCNSNAQKDSELEFTSMAIKRQWLFANVESSKERFNKSLRNFEESIDLLEKIKKNKSLIDQIGFFKTKQKIKIPKVITFDNSYQFCDNCKQICCKYCKWPPNEPYSLCTYFDPKSNRGCPICPGHCNKYAHLKANKLLVYEEKEEEEEVIIDAKKKANEEGLKGLSYSDIILNESIEKMKKEGEQILKQLGEIKTSLDELDKIALKT